MNKTLLRIRLEKMLPADEALQAYNSIIKSKDVDRIVDIFIDNGLIKYGLIHCSPRENLKKAIRLYFESKYPEDITTYTRLDNLAKDTSKDFDRLIIETITEAMIELEDLYN